MKRISLVNLFKSFILIIFTAAAVMFPVETSFAGEDDIRADEITSDEIAVNDSSDSIAAGANPAEAAVISEKLGYFQSRSGARSREKAGDRKSVV